MPGLSSDSPVDAIEAQLAAMLRDGDKTDGIIGGSTNSALAAVAAVESCGRVLGDDADVFTKEAITFLRRVRPRILAIHEDVAAAGDFLARAAMSLVRTP
jgi:LacI family transcriptional regulator